jgi:hypothetical protein
MKDSSVARLLYARVKATMTLRKSGDLPSATGQWLRRLRLPALLAGAAVFVLTTFPGGSGAGVSDYTGTLYLDGPPSVVAGGSFQLLTSAGPAAPGAPNAAAGLGGSGTIPSGNYLYIAVAISGSAHTAGSASNQVSVPANGSVSLANVPTGSLVYRLLLSTTAGSYKLVSPPGGTTTVPFVDDGSVNSTVVLPQADNRAPSFTTGYADFTPGTVYPSSSGAQPPLTASPTAPSVCRGWIVDGSGGLSFPAGTWTFQARVKSGSSTSGTAVLTAALYRVGSSGAPLATLIPPTDGAGNMINLAGTAGTFTVSAAAGAFSLGTNEHLCVQFWRHQTVAYSGGGATAHTLSLLGYDSANQITAHPAPNAFASAALSSPAEGSSSQTIPTLSATYSDAEGDAGTLSMRLCSDLSCGTELQNSGALAATNGATLTWNPAGPLPDATYYWQAQAQDGVGSPSAWTSSRSFVIDNAAPTTTITASPPSQSNAPSGSFSFSANESVTGFECRVDGAAFAACVSPHGYGPLGDGSHTFDVRAVADLAGNAGTTTSYSWTIDTTPPDTSITSSPSSLSNNASPSFGFSATQSGSTFECSLDGAAFAACPNPQGYSGVADGPHTFEVRAVDPAGNNDPSPASYAWTIDATPPDTTIGPSQPALLTTATGATFDFSSSEAPATFQCSLDGAAFASCTSPKAYSALADGSHTFQVRALDTATNADPSPASYTWTIDTTPPVTSFGTAKPSPNTSSSNATFDLASNEAGSTFECRLDGAPFGACTSPMTYTGLADGWHTFEVRATDPIGNVDTGPATYTWRIDNVAPSTPAPSGPVGGLVTSAPPLLRSAFTDATVGGDTGTVEYRICSSAAPAGTACTPVVQTITSGSVSAGGSATATPAALPDGTYYWQARARDAAGNYSPWSATQSFQLDTIPPDVPVLGPPDDGAWVSKVQLGATFSKPSFAGTGTIEFRICSDGLCLGIVTGGTSEPVINGGLATWAPSRSTLRNGLYYWQARAIDAAGNQSAWSASRILNVRRLAVRVKPKRVVCGAGSVLRLRVELSTRAKVRNRLLTGRGRLVRRGALRMMGAGATKVRVKLPRPLRHGSYRLVFDATAPGEKARAVVAVKVGSRTCAR